MIKLKLFLLLLTAAFVAKAQNPRYDTIRYARDLYKQRVELFQKEPIKKGRTIFIGNSIVQFADWKKLLNDSTIVNRGVAGDNTFGVLDRLDEVIARQPGKLFIELGINDISQNIPVEIIVKNISKIVQRVREKSANTKVYVFSVLPTNSRVKEEYPDAYNKNNQTNEVNTRLGKLADEGKFVFVDLNKELRDKNGELAEKYAKPDGLHLSDEGYRVCVQVLKRKGYL